ncbi:DELLA protein GAIP-B [Ricinus communis]|uniref:DELLA protein GAIP-B, putative n=1 Tax=Ricinus communis TaxID=3988 RepID=B9R6X6_RICCO|nr:DELLA protein GAIP-B [Ricinus communis]EEF52256.1 DELLA protein GAIP-B, putative [Ricinus communis]|eukprot:XP_002510069.1 DELLA protein GAIP-B [Ricinus communis]
MHWVFPHPSSANHDSLSKPSSTTSPNITDHAEHFQLNSSFSSRESERFNLEPQHSSACSSSSTVDGPYRPFSDLAKSIHPILEIDFEQNTRVPLFNMLIACAEAVEENNLHLAEIILSQILVNSKARATQSMAALFAEAMSSRVYRLYPQYFDYSYLNDIQRYFYKEWSYVKAAHLTANREIFETFAGKKHIHVIDFFINHGTQWSDLMQDLAARPGGPPTIRISGIGFPNHDNSDYLKSVGWKLAQLAETLNIDFEYRGFLAYNLADLDAAMLELRTHEAIAVNAVFALHKLLARPGDIHKLLSMVKHIEPEIFTIIEQESDNNDQGFSYRFNECINYFSFLLESSEGSTNCLDTYIFLRNQIHNIVVCEGEYRVERYEKLTRWRTRLEAAGFVLIHLGSNVGEYASFLSSQPATRNMLQASSKCTIEENNGCWMLGWRTRPLIAISAWRADNRILISDEDGALQKLERM